MSSLADLKAKVSLCRAVDQRRFKRRLSKLKPEDKKLAALADEIDKSAAWVAQREQLFQPVTFPDLPVSQRKDEIAEIIDKHQVVVLAGETGSGKTTQLPKICWELGRGKFGLIGHTQPRRLAARAVADRIAEELDTSIGDLVGYQVRFGDQTTESSRIKLMTDGILLAEIQNDPFLNRYDTLIIDEAHERSLNIDFLLGYLKRILPKRPDLKLIITSATIDLERFSSHFDNAPVIEVSGRTYPVDVLYRPLLSDRESGEGDLSIQQAIADAVDEIESIERSQKLSSRGDVLVFLSGERDIRETADFLRKQEMRDTDILPLYARLSNAEQNKIFHPSGRGRRIVLSTNVAETSLTVPGIRYVIDPGVARISRYSYRSKVQRLPIEAISQASANQRKGRCGRVAEGVCIRLYDEADFISRSEFTDAEILRTNLAAVILRMQGLKLGSIEDFPFIDPPDSRVVRDGVRLLQELQALDHRGEITPLGRQLSKLPVDPKLGRMLIEAARTNSLTEVLIIVCALSAQDPRERPHDKQQKADEKHRVYQDKDSDFISFVNLWNVYEEQRQELSSNQLRRYCQKNFLAYMRMREWRDLHRQLHLACKDLGLKENSSPASYPAIHKSLISGLLGNLGFKQEEGDYLGARNRKFRIFPGSGLYKKRPKWIVAAEVVETSQLYARTVAKIEPEWIEPLAQHLVKRSYSEPHWERKPAEVIAYEQQMLYGLQIVNRRKVHYGRIDPQESQEIFVRSALVGGDYQTNAEFYQYNRELLAEVVALEDKSRRRDILVDEEQLFEFYMNILHENQGERVVNGASFEKWRKQVESTQPALLKLTRAALMNHTAEEISEERFPEYLEQGSLKLPLNYHFDPGAKHDGVTVKVPVGALSQLSENRLEWLVPGMIKDKCQALLKGLPKQYRKSFVPIPDYVDAFLQSETNFDRSLTESLSERLRQMTGVRTDKDLWKGVEIDSHHQFNLQVVDDKGEILSEGRDLNRLQQQFADFAQKPTETVSEVKEVVDEWDFGALSETMERQQAGISLKVYPALTYAKGKLTIVEYSTLGMAKAYHAEGVIELLRRSCSRQVAYVEKALKQRWTIVALKLSKVASAKSLWADLVFAAISQTIESKPLPRSEAEFDSLKEQVNASLFEYSEQLLTLLDQIASLYQGIQRSLKGQVQLAWATILQDISGQLARLISADFIREVPQQHLKRYPIYLKAIEERLSKFQQDLNKQRFFSEQLAGMYEKYDSGIKRVSPGSSEVEPLNFYRWMLEEYRVSLFAQQLKTAISVSDKKIDRYWRENCS